MRTSPTNSLIEHLRQAVLLPECAAFGDAVLLGRFIERHDEAAFAVVVNRHGPMVWGLCRRLLHQHDAEDAFQATFLVLARKAASIRSKEMVGNWLYGVAYQTALQARRTTARRRAKEVQVTKMPDIEAVAPDPCADIHPLLDAELSRLPDIYRAVIVACDLEGRTRREVARHLGVPEGTVAARVARARAMLAKRLTQRGVTLSGGALAAMLATQAASAGVPKSVVVSTIKAASLLAAGTAAATGAISVKAAALTEGVMKAMLLNQLKTAIVTLLVIAFLGLSGGAYLWQSQASGQPADQPSKGKSPSGKDEDIKKKLLELDELWWKGDVETLRKLAADDLITVSAVGRYDKASLLAAAKNTHAVDWTKRDVEVSRVSGDVAIVTYLYDCKIFLRDGTLFQNCRGRRLSMTWVYRKGGWVVVFSHETILSGGE
jgi:RNA polymerase sigma factor (sigma-70 family)